MKERAKELGVILVLTILAAGTFAYGIEYFITLYSLSESYRNVITTVTNYIAPTSDHGLKNNSSSSYLANSTKFYAIYFSLNSSELNSTSRYVRTLLHDLDSLPLIAFFTLGSFAFYLISFFRWFCRLIRSPNIRGLFLLFAHSQSFFIVLIVMISGLTFLSPRYGIALALTYSIEHLNIPFGLVTSIPETLIFGLDLTLFLVYFLSERISKFEENLITKINAIISMTKKEEKNNGNALEQRKEKDNRIGCINEIQDILAISNIFDGFIDILSLLIKLIIVIVLPFSIGMSILAYFNEAFLSLDMVFFVNSILSLVLFGLLILGIDFVLYLYLKALRFFVDSSNSQ